jgi:hypothetical protein
MDDGFQISIPEPVLLGEVCRGLAMGILEWSFTASPVQFAQARGTVAEALEHLAGGGAAAGAVADMRGDLLAIADADALADFLNFARLIVDGGDDDYLLRPRLLRHLRRLAGWMDGGR